MTGGAAPGERVPGNWSILLGSRGLGQKQGMSAFVLPVHFAKTRTARRVVLNAIAREARSTRISADRSPFSSSSLRTIFRSSSQKGLRPSKSGNPSRDLCARGKRPRTPPRGSYSKKQNLAREDRTIQDDQRCFRSTHAGATDSLPASPKISSTNSNIEFQCQSTSRSKPKGTVSIGGCRLDRRLRLSGPGKSGKRLSYACVDSTTIESASSIPPAGAGARVVPIVFALSVEPCRGNEDRPGGLPTMASFFSATSPNSARAPLVPDKTRVPCRARRMPGNTVPVKVNDGRRTATQAKPVH